MKKVLYFLVLCAVLSPSVYSQLDLWVQTTSSVGSVWGMVIDPGNQNIMYTGSNTLGVYKTTDGGTTWSPMNTGITNTQVQAIAISQNNPQNLYAGTATGGVYKTTDGGANWTQVNNGITETTISIQALLVHPTDPNIAWCAVFDGVSDAVNGLYKTTDGGVNWFPITTGIGAIKNFLCLAISPTDPNILLAGSSFTVATSTGPSAIYKSTDGGANWALSSTGLPTDPTEINPIRALSFSTANSNVVVAGLFMNTVNGGFYVSTDAGANWTKKHNGLPPDIGTLIRSVAIRPGFENQFYVGLDRSTFTNIGVFMTTDGGDNWVSFNGGAMLNTYSVRALKFNSTGNHTLFAGCSSTPGSGVYQYSFSVLPVELASFAANISGNDVNLSWITATETNNYGFEVEKNISGSSEWNKIGFIFGNGTTTELHHYSYTDQSVKTGKYSYRLKQIDFDGNFNYSDAVDIEVIAAKNFVLNQNYPNPFNPTTRISFSIPQSGFATLKVYNVLGVEVATVLEKELTEGNYDFDFNASSLTSGVYYYTLKSGNFVETKKMMLLK
jgi:Sortilin, neurotensin receptor 3,/Secretion system C-terminal sorting domain